MTAFLLHQGDPPEKHEKIQRRRRVSRRPPGEGVKAMNASLLRASRISIAAALLACGLQGVARTASVPTENPPRILRKRVAARPVAFSSPAKTFQAAPVTIPLGQFTFNAQQFGDTLDESDGGTYASTNWLNVTNANPGNPAYLTGPSFDTGVANIGKSFNVPTYTIHYNSPIVNGVGTDLGIVSARYSLNDTFWLAVSTDGLTFTPLMEFGPALAVNTFVSKSYYYSSDQVFPATLYVTPVELSDFGLPPDVGIVAARITSTPEGDLIRVAGLNGENRINFDISLSSTEKILAHKVRTDDTQYLSSRQTIDGQVPITGDVRDETGHPIAGATVLLRVVDPADTAPYTPAAMKHENDNADPADMQGANLNARLSAASVLTGADGKFSVTLTVSDHVAGDNYKVEGSFGSSFPCATAGANGSDACKSTGTIQVWKRVYVEKHRMLRNGIRLSQNALSGATSIRVVGNHYQGNQGNRTLAAGDHIVLVHAPQRDRSDVAGGWYVEYHDVASVQAVVGTGEYIVNLGTVQGKTVTPQSLAQPFAVEATDGLANDAIARISGATISTADYFDAPDTLLAQYDASGNPASAFSQSFVDYVVLPDAPLVPLPWIRSDQSDETLQHVASRWSRSMGWDTVNSRPLPTPSHQLLAVADIGSIQQGQPSEAGRSTFLTTEASSYVFRGAIDTLVNISGNPHFHQNAANWAAKNEIHELTHQWRVDSVWNQSPPVHCPSNSLTYDSATTYCVEAASDPARSETQSANLIAKFHMIFNSTLNVYHSEYFEIRQHADPFLP